MRRKEVPRAGLLKAALAGKITNAEGAVAMHVSLRTPSPEAHLVALRTQQVIALETGVTRVADPLGGSWYVESLTGNSSTASAR